MKFLSPSVIKIDRELSALDQFTIEFTKILSKHTTYVIISGYVAILLGRARASEDVDIIIPKIPFIAFQHLLQDLKENDFYCLNAESKENIYDYLQDNVAVRFAKNQQVIPNMELKFAKNKIDELTLNKTLEVQLNKEKIIISHLELQIAFKEEVLKSPKDLEDARHIRSVAAEYLNQELIKKYKVMLHEFY